MDTPSLAAAGGDGAALGQRAGRRLAQLVGTDRIAPGLSADELAEIEQHFGFEFADDHRAFLATGLPIDDGWPDWRHGPAQALRRRLERPIDGVLFDVEHNDFWYEPWGEPPSSMAAALVLARERLSRVPRLVPVHSHRYLPAGRGSFGHPVLSVVQTDIIGYGRDLLDYIGREFGARGVGIGTDDEGAGAAAAVPARATVEFWRDLMS